MSARPVVRMITPLVRCSPEALRVIGAIVTTNVILHIRGKPGTATALPEAVHAIGSARAASPAFRGGRHYVDNDAPEHIIEVQPWDPAEAQQAFMAEIRAEFADVFAMLDGPPDITYADER
jgi:hypothetical protein